MGKKRGSRHDPPTNAWPKGVSGNPGGRPKVVQLVREKAQDNAERCIEILMEVAERGDKDASRVAASKEILDRAVGRATQGIEISGPGGSGVKVDLTKLPSEDLEALHRIVAKANKAKK